jgi:hypothetical protein
MEPGAPESVAQRVGVMGFERALVEEIASLERELERDTRFQRWRALCAARDLYPSEAGSPLSPSPAAPVSRTEVIPSSEYRARFQPPPTAAAKKLALARRGGRKRGPSRAHALDLTVELLTGRSGLTTIDAIYTHLASRGVELGGANPKNNLSSMLYKDKRFQSHGRRGWELVRERPAAPTLDGIVGD